MQKYMERTFNNITAEINLVEFISSCSNSNYISREKNKNKNSMNENGKSALKIKSIFHRKLFLVTKIVSG